MIVVCVKFIQLVEQFRKLTDEKTLSSIFKLLAGDHGVDQDVLKAIITYCAAVLIKIAGDHAELRVKIIGWFATYLEQGENWEQRLGDAVNDLVEALNPESTEKRLFLVDTLANFLSNETEHLNDVIVNSVIFGFCIPSEHESDSESVE